MFCDAYPKMKAASGGWLFYKATGTICTPTPILSLIYSCEVNLFYKCIFLHKSHHIDSLSFILNIRCITQITDVYVIYSMFLIPLIPTDLHYENKISSDFLQNTILFFAFGVDTFKM